jgi:hypothetical protein
MWRGLVDGAAVCIRLRRKKYVRVCKKNSQCMNFSVARMLHSAHEKFFDHPNGDRWVAIELIRGGAREKGPRELGSRGPFPIFESYGMGLQPTSGIFSHSVANFTVPAASVRRQWLPELQSQRQ